MTDEQPKNIHEAIVRIMTHVGYVQKQKGVNLNYTFAGESALIEAIRPYMVEFGVYCYVVDVSDEVFESYTTAKGAVMNMARLKMTTRFVHAASGTFIDTVARGQGADSGDKSDNKASTGAYKYNLRQTFCIETGDDPDKDSSAEQGKTTSGSGQKSHAAATPISKPWYENALDAVRTKSAVWDKPLGATPHGNAFIAKLISDHIGEGQWWETKPHFLNAVHKYSGFKTPEEMSWTDAGNLIRIETGQRAKKGDIVAHLVWQGIFTAEQWTAICEASGLKLTDVVDTDEKVALLRAWFKSMDGVEFSAIDPTVLGATLAKIMGGK